MTRKSNLLNVRKHLEHIQQTIELFNQHGACPLFSQELKTISIVNQAIMLNHDALRAQGSRKDIRMEAGNGTRQKSD